MASVQLSLFQVDKLCTKCGRRKPLPAFSKRSRSKDGLQAWCRTCMTAAVKLWDATNGERKKARDVDWRRRNPGKSAEYSARYYKRNAAARRVEALAYKLANPDKVRKHQRAFKARHPDKIRAYQRVGASRRRARERGAVGQHSIGQMAWRAELFGRRCWMCLDAYEQDDHVIPISENGPDWASNMRPACGTCNRKKGASLVPMSDQKQLLAAAFALKGQLP